MALQLLYVKVELFFQQLLLYVISVNLEGWSSIFLVSYEPKYTQIDLIRQLTSTNIFYFQSDDNFPCFSYISTMQHE